MVAICILDAFEDMSINFPNEGGLLIRKNVFNSLNGAKKKSKASDYREYVTGEKGFTFWTTRHPYI